MWGCLEMIGHARLRNVLSERQTTGCVVSSVLHWPRFQRLKDHNKGSKNNVIRYSGIYLIKRALIKGVSLSQVKIRLLRSAGICSRSSASCSHSQRAAQRKAGLGDIPSTLIWLWFNTHYSGGEVLSLAIQQGCNSPPLLIMIGILKKRRL